MNYWQNKIVLVTGASAGFGRVLARQFAERGCQVILVARDVGKLNEAAADLSERGGRATALPADITRAEEIKSLFARVAEGFGRLDVLANIAGKSARGEVRNTTVDEFRDLLELNFLATVACTHAALPLLLESHGHVINMGSLAAKGASRFIGGYPASKFPLAAYSQQLRLELREQGLHTLLVCPGPIRRGDAGSRYDAEANGLPPAAARPGGGVRLSGIDPVRLAEKILAACERRQAELVIPRRARLLFALAQLSPR
ncbi:MAG: SDR family NAD(P)-dependent oxidoreductase, partial [Pirellulales bacterium]